ncbi:acid phosphatase, partial [Phenoliferia sp. Uapishka_3]
MATFASLPPEIISRVFYFVNTASPPLPNAFDDEHEEDRTPARLDLVASSLISSTFRHPAQRELFKHIYVKTVWTAAEYENLRSASQELRKCIRSLVINLSNAHPKSWLDWAMLCPNLRVLAVLGENLAPMHVGWGELGDPSFSGLKNLILRCPEDFLDPHLPSTPPFLLPFALTHLSLWLASESLSDASSTSPAFLSALLTSSKNSLISLGLRIYDAPSEIPLIPSFHLAASNLRELILESDYHIFRSHRHIFGSLISLKVLIFKESVEDMVEEEDDMADHIKTLLDALPKPPTLEELTIAHAYRFNCFRFLLDHPSLDHLKVLSFPNLASNSPRNRSILPEFESECKNLGRVVIAGKIWMEGDENSGSTSTSSPVPSPIPTWTQSHQPLSKRSTFFRNTQNASDAEFNPLHHLAGIAPYFNSPGVELNPSPPSGCTVESAAYLIRHSNIEVNDFDYESIVQPFLLKLANVTSPSTTFANTSLSFLSTYVPLISPQNATSQIEEVPTSGQEAAERLGGILAKYHEHLTPDANGVGNGSWNVWSATAERDMVTAEFFVKGAFGEGGAGIVLVGEGEEEAANTLTPHESCDTFSGSAGSNQSDTFKSIYAQPAADRLNAQNPAFNWTSDDIYAMQELCGYDTVISNVTSPFCSSDAFTNEDWLGFEYTNDLMYQSVLFPRTVQLSTAEALFTSYSLGYGADVSPYLGMPWVAASTDLILGTNLSVPTNSSNSTLPFTKPSQKLFISFSHREEPAFLVTALGIYNNSVGIYGNETNITPGGNINDTMPDTSINPNRAWKTSEILPFLGHVALENVYCPANSTNFVRVLVNHAPIPIPNCQSGPDSSCPASEFVEYITGRQKLYGDFVGACGLTGQANATDGLGIYYGDILT